MTGDSRELHRVGSSMAVVDIESLKKSRYLSGLGADDLHDIVQFFFERTVERNEIIVHEDEPASALFIVVSGAVKILKTSSEGKEQILGILRPGDAFNDVPVFDGRPAPAGAVAMSKVSLYGLSRADIHALMLRHPQMAMNAIQILAAGIRHYITMVEDLSFKNVTSRVAKLLLQYAPDQARIEAAGGPTPRLTQQDMAGLVGTSREVVGRSLKALEEEGAIKVDRHRIAILDKDVLEERSAED